MNEKKMPSSPEVAVEVKPYWDAAAKGKLLIKTCDSCGKKHFYPRVFCPFCMSENTSWLECTGSGSIYSFTITSRAPFFQVPAMIALDEGPIMLSAFVDCDFSRVIIGARVKVTFNQTFAGQPIPVFYLE